MIQLQFQYGHKASLLILSVISNFLLVGTDSAHAEEHSKFDLTPGYYIYLGPQPGRVAPRAFTINGTGSVYWQDNTTSTEEKLPGLDLSPLPANRPSRQSASSQPSSDQYESINYPIIKWKPKPISSLPGGFVQLSTTYEQNYVKYKVTLFKSKSLQAAPKNGMNPPLSPAGIPTFPIDVQLLDQNGFKLVQFTVNQNQWDVIPGTNVLEARDQLSCNEWDYKRSRDYTVK